MHLGIDLGTSNSAIVGNSGGRLRLFKTADERDVLPSVLYADRRGARFVGRRAYEQLQIAPQNVAHGFKRLMGTDSVLELKAAGIAVTPEDASAEVLRALLAQVRAAEPDAEIEGAVITIPAAFNQMQSEATIRAARAAGLDRVGLIQEPVAAAMAALEEATRRDGLFLVYDLGGGTFDAALVRAQGGNVAVLAHEGANMLGGRDFDRVVLDSVVRPWLERRYRLPMNPGVDPAYKRLFDIARARAEEAKIDLSTRETATVFVSEEDARAEDLDGEPIFVEAPVTRAELEALVADRIDESITLCRKLLKDSGVTHEDVDRIVLIGGPSRMPVVRARVPQALGVPADAGIDPMTAVARGAAIFAESRDWSGARSERKASRVRTDAAELDVAVTHSQRIADENGRIRVSVGERGRAAGYRLRIIGSGGHDSGEVRLTADHDERVTIPTVGEHRFRVVVRDAAGASLLDRELLITRAHAAASAATAAQTVAVKVVSGPASAPVNRLAVLVAKGTPLPADGVAEFKTTREIVGGREGFIDVELFNQAEGVDAPELNLMVGTFRVDGTDLDVGERAPAGSPLRLHWTVNDDGLLRCEVELPDQGVRLDGRNFYLPQAGQQVFSGEEGAAVAGAALDAADAALTAARDAVGGRASAELARLERRLARQRELLAATADAEARRAVSEEARLVMQDIARLRAQPEHRRPAMLAEIAGIEEAFADRVDDMEPAEVQRMGTLARAAKDAVARENWDRARELIEEMRGIMRQAMFADPGFWAHWLERFARERFAAVDKRLHDAAVASGRAAAEAGDFDGVRRAVVEIAGNRAASAGADRDVSMLAGLALR